MIFNAKWFFIVVTVTSTTCQQANLNAGSSMCGCRAMRACYARMLDELTEQDEERCLEPLEMSTSTMLVYFKALTKYCGHLINVTKEHLTHESRYLYEVHLHKPKEEGNIDYDNLPLILIEAGQCGGLDPVQAAMHIIEHLMACEEHENLLTNFRWVILPCVNPDGMEYVRFDRPNWRKNTRKSEGVSYGIDITRNFDNHWDECPKNTNGFSRRYPGPEPASEAETRFVKDVIKKHKDYMKAYLSFKRDGHGILYPHGYTEESADIPKRTIEVADLISQKVNQRGQSQQTFLNTSIYEWAGEAVCGNSVDFVFHQGIELAYEMRVGFGKELEIIQKFHQSEPRNRANLLSAYFSGVRELSRIVAEKIESDKGDKVVI